MSDSENRDAFLSLFTDAPSSGILRYSGEGTVFQSPQGIYVDISPNSLFLQDGRPVSGDVKIELQENTAQRKNLLKSPDFLTSSGCLECEKLIRFKITHKGTPVVLSSPVQLFLPSEYLKKDADLYFHVVTNAKDSLWIPLPTQELVAEDEVWNFNLKDKLYECRGYRIQVNRADEWYCIGQAPIIPWSEDAGKCVQLPKLYNAQNTVAFFIASKKNIFVRLDWDFSEACLRFPFTPANESLAGKILFLSSFGEDNYHFGMTHAVWNQEIIEIQPNDLKPATKNEILIALGDL